MYDTVLSSGCRLLRCRQNYARYVSLGTGPLSIIYPREIKNQTHIMISLAHIYKTIRFEHVHCICHHLYRFNFVSVKFFFLHIFSLRSYTWRLFFLFNKIVFKTMKKRSCDFKNVMMLSLRNPILLRNVRTRSLMHDTSRASETLKIMVYEF